jgi:hypothetical protein
MKNLALEKLGRLPMRDHVQQVSSDEVDVD